MLTQFIPGGGGDDVSLVGGEGAAEDGEVVSVERVLERPARRLQAVRHRHQRVVAEPELVALPNRNATLQQLH